MLHLQDYPELAGKSIHPAGWRILVRRLDPGKEIKLASGVVLTKPDQTVAMEKGGMDIGQVLEIGTACWLRHDHGTTPWCSVGDFIRFYAYKGADVEDETGDRSLALLNDSDVLGVYRDKEQV